MTKKTSMRELDLAPMNAFLPGGQSYILPKGKVGQRDSKRHLYLCWQKTEDGIYYTCPCGRINRMCVNVKDPERKEMHCGVFLEGSVVGTFGCEYCPSCQTHRWYVLKDFPVKGIQKRITKEPRQCPICKYASFGKYSNFTYCGRCNFHWQPQVKPAQIGATT